MKGSSARNVFVEFRQFQAKGECTTVKEKLRRFTKNVVVRNKICPKNNQSPYEQFNCGSNI